MTSSADTLFHTSSYAPGYLDFNTLSLSIPGMTFDLKRYWDGTSPVRYILKDQSNDEVFAVVQFMIQDLDA